jgi:hypothetical protein
MFGEQKDIDRKHTKEEEKGRERKGEMGMNIEAHRHTQRKRIKNKGSGKLKVRDVCQFCSVLLYGLFFPF